MNIRNTFHLSASLMLAFASVATVRADQDSEQGPHNVKGEYRVIVNQVCVRTPFQPPPANGFDPNTKQLLVEGETIAALGTGLLRFEDDGTLQMLEGTQTEVSFGLIAPGKTPITPPAQFTCSGNYTADGDKVSFTLTCDIKVPDPSLKVTVGPQQFEGYVDREKKTMNLTNIAGGIQAITVSMFGNPVQQRQRICTQHSLLAR